MDLLELESHVALRDKRPTVLRKRTTYLPIDSRFRQKQDLNITDTHVFLCPPGPISVTENGTGVTVTLQEDHNLVEGDLFVLDNIRLATTTIFTTLTLDADKIYIPLTLDVRDSLLLPPIGVNLQKSTVLEISFSNIAISVVSQTSSILSTSVTDDLFLILDGLKQVSITQDESYILILLDRSVFKQATYDVSIDVTPQHIGGIPLRYLQANIPLDDYHATSAHTISSSTRNSFTFVSKQKADRKSVV